MEEALPTDVAVSFAGSPADFETYAFRKPSGEIMVSAALAGSVTDGPAPRRRTDVTIKNVRPKKVSVIDLLNGFEQELQWSAQGNDFVVRGLNVPDYPVMIRIVP